MAGNRSITVTLRANVQDFKSQFDAATRAAESTAKATEQSAQRADTAMGRMVQSARDNRQAWDLAGGTLTAFGAATLGGLGLATKAAMDWESAWAGVTKTVEGTPEQMGALEEGLRGLARELPASHQEIAAVAEAAGQLGIATPNVLDFTRTMIDMGEATNLSAEEAATSLARFMNVMGTSQSDVGRLGASVVGLGNNFATTESEIVQMSQRLAGAGAQAGLTEGDVLGVAAAMSSVGIEAEAGGSAMSLTMKRIGKAVDEGGDSLDLFAQVSGMSAEAFAQAWQSDPAMALDSFITGLSTVESQGMTTNGVLAELGITGIRESDALLRLSAAAGEGADGMSLLAGAVEMGNEEFDKGTALVEEAAQRYETAESKIAMARNTLVDLGISVGGQVLPALAGLAESGANVVGWFADLPDPVQRTGTALAGIAGAASLGAGGFLLLFPRVMDAVGAFRDLRNISPRAATSLGKVGRAVGITTAAFGALGAIEAYGDSLTDFSIGANEAADMAIKTADAVDPLQHVFSGMGEETYIASASTKEMAGNLDVLANGSFWGSISDKTAGLANAFGANVSTLEDSRQRLEEYGQGLAGLAQTDLPAAQEAFSALWDAFGGSEEAGANLLKTMPALREELIRVASNAGLATDDATLLKIATGELSPVVEDATVAADGFEEGLSGVEQAAIDATSAVDDHLSAISDVANAFLESRDATRDFEDALADAYELLEENDGADHWGDDTQAARDYEEAVDGVASAYLRELEAARENGDSTAEIMQARRDDIIALGEAYNIPKDELNEYLELLGLTPEEIEQVVTLETEQAKADWAALWDELGYHPPQVPVGADTEPAEGDVTLFQEGLVSSDPTLAPVGADTSGAKEDVDEFGAGVGDTETTPLEVTANIQPAMAEVLDLEDAINASGGTVVINGNATPGDQVLDTLMGIINSSGGTVTIDGQSYPADEALAAAIVAINNGRGVVEIDGDNSGANSATDSAKRKADNTSGTIDVYANTSSANASINNAARNRTAVINVITTGATSALRAGTRAMSMRASGGPVFGPGTETSDSIPAMLSHNEHVWAAREVKAAGGHASLANIRAQILGGAKTIRLATGGAADGSVRVVQPSPMVRMPDMASSPASPVDYAQMGAYMREAVSGMTVALNLDGRTLYGAVVDAGKAQRSQFVTRRG